MFITYLGLGILGILGNLCSIMNFIFWAIEKVKQKIKEREDRLSRLTQPDGLTEPLENTK